MLNEVTLCSGFGCTINPLENGGKCANLRTIISASNILTTIFFTLMLIRAYWLFVCCKNVHATHFTPTVKKICHETFLYYLAQTQQ